MKESLTPRERIRKKKDFLFIYRKGHRYRGKYFTLIYLANNLVFPRMGVVASKKVGNAVQRNRVKRWMRELFRRNKGLLKAPIDILIVAKKEVQDVSWPMISKEYLFAIKSIFRKNQFS
jgi:ribonuclease P protein component